jgi:hypothetical protein
MNRLPESVGGRRTKHLEMRCLTELRVIDRRETWLTLVVSEKAASTSIIEH